VKVRLEPRYLQFNMRKASKLEGANLSTLGRVEYSFHVQKGRMGVPDFGGDDKISLAFAV
jgi:hypothetical protein